MNNERPPFPTQEGTGTEAGWGQQPTSPLYDQPTEQVAQTAPSGQQAGEAQPASYDRQSAGYGYDWSTNGYGAQAAQQPAAQAQEQVEATRQQPAATSFGAPAAQTQATQTQATQTQARPAAAPASYRAPEADWSQQARQAQQAAPSAGAHYAQQPPVQSQQPTSTRRERRGGGVRAAVLGLVFGVLGAVGTVFALRQFGLIGGTTVVTENAEGKTVAITASAEDSSIAKAVSEKVLPSVVSVHVTTNEGSGLGSGVILDTEGNILTNNHVAGDATSITVTIDGKSYDATLVGTDASSDLAVVKADLGGAKVTPIERGDSDALAVGDWVMTVGSPFGLDQSVSAGIVSSLARNELMTSYSGNTLYANLIQTDAAINPGNSGGALVNDRGQLVGISTLFSSDTESFAGIGFAIPGNYALDVAEKIIAGETVTHAYIGLSMQTVTAQNASRNNLAVNQGAYVAEVAEGGPAAEAGIQVGDIITSMNGQDITSADGMILAVRSHKIGETVEVTLMRGTDELTVEVTLGSDEALQAQQQRLLDEQQTTQVDGLNGYVDERGTTDSYGQRDILQELYEYLYNNRGGSYEIELDDAA